MAVAVGLGLYADFGALGSALAAFDWRLFPLALALTLVNYLIRFGRWQLYLHRLGIEIPRLRSLTIFFAGLVGTITPAKLGEVVKSALLRRGFGTPIARSAPIVVVERISDALGIVVLAVLGGAGATSSPALVVGALAGALGLAILLRTPLLDRFALLAESRASAGELLGLPLLAGTTVLSALSWFFECLAAWVCVQGLGLDVSLPDTVVVFSVASLAGALSFLPGGLGVAEAGMTGLLRAIADVGAAGAAAATVLIRLSTLWFAVALGLVALAVEQRLARAAPYEPVPAEPPGRRSSIR